jgi:hypothetical protein
MIQWYVIRPLGITNMDADKRAISIYVDKRLYARIEAVAKEENRSMSNYLGGLLERAHPPTSRDRPTASQARKVR